MNWWIGFMTLTSKFEDNIIMIGLVISLIRLEKLPHLSWTGRGYVCVVWFWFCINVYYVYHDMEKLGVYYNICLPQGLFVEGKKKS